MRPLDGLIRTQSLARCLTFAARKAATIERAWAFQLGNRISRSR